MIINATLICTIVGCIFAVITKLCPKEKLLEKISPSAKLVGLGLSKLMNTKLGISLGNKVEGCIATFIFVLQGWCSVFLEALLSDNKINESDRNINNNIKK